MPPTGPIEGDALSMYEDFIRRGGGDLGIDTDRLITAARNEMESIPSDAELFRCESQLWEHFSNASLSAEGDFQHAQLVAWSWIAQTYRQTHSAFILYQQGFPDTSAANARCAVEHGVYLSLLSGVENVESVLGPLERSYLRNAQNALSPTADEESELVLDLISSVLQAVVGPPSPGITNFQQVCNRLDTGMEVYRQYRVLSSLVHTGFGVASPYVAASIVGQDSGGPVCFEEPVFVGSRIGLWMAIGGCAWAGWSADRLFNVDYFGPLLDSTARPFRFQPLEITGA